MTSPESSRSLAATIRGALLIDSEIYTPRKAIDTFLKVQKPAMER